MQYMQVCYYTVSQKKVATLTMATTLSDLGGFAKFFHCCKVVSDTAIFVLRRDVKLQLTN